MSRSCDSFMARGARAVFSTESREVAILAPAVSIALIEAPELQRCRTREVGATPHSTPWNEGDHVNFPSKLTINY